MIEYYALLKRPCLLNPSTRPNIPEYLNHWLKKFIEAPGALKLNVLVYSKAQLLPIQTFRY
jgi:hypothetical protein